MIDESDEVPIDLIEHVFGSTDDDVDAELDVDADPDEQPAPFEAPPGPASSWSVTLTPATPARPVTGPAVSAEATLELLGWHGARAIPVVDGSLRLEADDPLPDALVRLVRLNLDTIWTFLGREET